MHHNILNGTFNFRDLGGYSGFEGKTVCSEKVYRSDALSSLSLDDVKTLELLGLKTIVDFRQPNEIEKAPNVFVPGTTTYNLSPLAPLAELSTGNIVDDKQKIDQLHEAVKDSAVWHQISQNGSTMAEQMRSMAFDSYSLGIFKEVFTLLLNPTNAPLVFHCKGGKDRTGLMALLFLMVLGVSKEDIIDDYMLTKTLMANRNQLRMNEYKRYTSNTDVLAYLNSLMDTKIEYITGVFDEINKLYPNHESYIMEMVGLNMEEINQLRNLYLE